MTTNDLVAQATESHESDYAAVVSNAEATPLTVGDGSPVPSQTATTFTAPTVAELTEAFETGAKRAGYIPPKATTTPTPTTPVNNKTDTPATDSPSTETASTKTTSSGPTVEELTEAFKAGVEGRRYTPKSVVHSESNETDIDNVAENSISESFTPRVDNVYDLQYVFSSDRDTVTSFAKDTLGLEDVSAYSEMNIEVANGINEAIEKVSSEFGDIIGRGYLKCINIKKSRKALARYSHKNRYIQFDPIIATADAMAVLKENAKLEYQKGGWTSPNPFHSIYHELGHAVQDMAFENNPKIREAIDALYQNVYYDIMGMDEWGVAGSQVMEQARKAKKAGTSFYGLYDPEEMVAEAIAQYYSEKSCSALSKTIIAVLKGE